MSRILGILLLSAFSLYAKESSVPADSAVSEKPGMTLAEYLAWPFSHVIQPALNVLVFPFSAPIHYAVKNDVIETGVDAITFGKDRNIFIYPTFNLRPGATTMMGFAYRHRNMILERDYFVFTAGLFANSDLDFTARYTKRNVFGSEFLLGGRLDFEMDRDGGMSVPRSLTLADSDEEFTFTDSSYSAEFRVGRPLPLISNMDFQATFGVERKRFDIPDVGDTVLSQHPLFNPYDRGLYQKYYQFPVKLALTYDNLDAPYVPTRGSRLSVSWNYTHVGDYGGKNSTLRSNEFSHDYQALDFVAQHYFYLGKDSSKYGLSAKEARMSRKFYTDFSWEETLRLWRPENIRSTLLNRRVLAVQFRLRQMWEMEEGGAPFTAFSTASTRYPLRGYSRTYTDYAMKGISLEYRWPIDRLVDGVIFDEYVMYGRTWHTFDSEKILNSWGFGVRVRKPDMYFFRLQIGFHGLSGFVLICTIAPEFQ